MKQQSIIILVIAFVVVAGGSFYGGMRYASSKSIKLRSAGGRMMGQGLRVGGGAMGARNGGLNATNGEITSKDEKSFTVKLSDGSSKIVLFSASTTVGEMTQGSMDSLTPGKTVMVMGKTGTDGSITATMVQIRAAGDSGVGGPFGGVPPTDGSRSPEAPAQQ